jgi:hypothetical protein
VLAVGWAVHKAEEFTERTTTSACPATGHGIQRHHVADPREEHLGAEQREETVGGGAPTGSRLGEVLQAGECQEALAAAIFLYPWTVAH